MKKMIFIILGIVMLAGCFPASFKSLTFPDPEYKGKTYQKFCVACYIEDDTYLRQLFEGQFKEVFFQNGYYCEESIRLFPPTRDWSDEKIHETLNAEGYDAYLLITTREQYTVTDFIPAQKTIQTTEHTEKAEKDEKDKKSKENKDKNDEEIVRIETVIKETPAHIQNNAYVTVEIKLIDVNTSDVAWVSYLKSNDGKGLFFESLYNKNKAEQIAENTLYNLQKDGFIKIHREK